MPIEISPMDLFSSAILLQPSSKFLQLPRELRDHIYSYLFISVAVQFGDHGTRKPLWLAPDFANLLPTCRQVYQELDSKFPVQSVVLDVTSEKSCTDAIAKVLETTDKLDILIHNAGAMCYGPAESFTPDAFAKYMDINCFGTQRLNRAVLPHMREQRDGLIVWISSSSTRGGMTPFLGPYFAAKAAMDSLAVTYSTELTRFGIETSIIVPGAFTKGTNHFAHAGQPDSLEITEQYLGEGKPYHGVGDQVLERMAELEPEWSNVEEVAKAIVKVVAAEKGTRPFRVHIDPIDDGSEAVNAVADQKRAELYKRIQMEDLLKPI